MACNRSDGANFGPPAGGPRGLRAARRCASLRRMSDPVPDPQPPVMVEGFAWYRGLLPRAAQAQVVADLRGVVRAAPMVNMTTPGGRQMKVRMTSAGRLGWTADRRGYRYEPRHPSGAPWPPIPDSVLAVWRAVAPAARAPDSCLVNYYGEGVKMSLHRDDTEADLEQPVVSISLGDPASFRIGGHARGDPTRSIRLESGDVLVMAGAARLRYHGIGRVFFGRSDLLEQGGRLNLTLRVAG